MIPRARSKTVILSFRIANVPSIDTFAGALRYVRTRARWNIRMFASPSVLTPDIVRSAAEMHVDGILADNPLHADLTDALLETDIPLVLIGSIDERLARRRNVLFFRMDNEAIGRMGARHFLSLGRYRSFGFLPDVPATYWSTPRLKGFREELAAHGSQVIELGGSAGEGAGCRAALIESLRTLDLPAAIMRAGDYQAADMFGACAEANLEIPSDVAVLGVDNNRILCDTLSISLSSIEPAFEKEGFDAALALDDLMRARKPQSESKTILIPPLKVVERASTKPLSPGTSLVARALEFIRANATEPITARHVAARLGVSPSLLALRFRQYEKRSVRDVLIAARLRRVADLLVGTSASVRSIAARCGFSSANRLTHLFKGKYSVSPRAWRQAGRKMTASVRNRDRRAP